MEKENTTRQMEHHLAELHRGIRDDLYMAKHEILDHLREIGTSVELIARELARRADK